MSLSSWQEVKPYMYYYSLDYLREYVVFSDIYLWCISPLTRPTKYLTKDVVESSVIRGLLG